MVRERETDMVREMRETEISGDRDSEINNVPCVVGRCGPNSVRL